MYDHVRLHESHTLPGFDRNPAEVNWQTKTLGRSRLGTYRITEDGRLLEEEFHYEEVPEEERPRYNEDIRGFESELDEFLGSLCKVSEGWTDTEFHGVFEFHASVDDEYVSYEAKFTDGKLEAFQRRDR